MEAPTPQEKRVEFVFYNLVDKIPHLDSTLAIRAALLLSDHVVYAGDLYLITVDPEELKFRKPKNQVAYMQTVYEQLGHTEHAEQVAYLAQALALATAEKHPPPRTIVLHKQTLRAIEAHFTQFRTWVADGFAADKLGILKKINTPTETILGSAGVQLENPETARRPYMKLSEVLLCANDPGTGSQDLMVLPGQSQDILEANGLQCLANFSLPDASTLTVEEIRLIRKQTAAPRQAFNAVLREVRPRLWNPAIPLWESLIPPFNDLALALQGNASLQAVAKALGSNGLEIRFGRVPLPAIWQYYEHAGLLPEETAIVLKQRLETHPGIANPVPVLIVTHIN